jgi:tetratricopeptide (TPR) repeat protein
MSIRDGAIRLMAESRFSRAEAEFRRAIVECSSEPQLLLDLGECLEKQNRFDEALRLYDQAIGDGIWWPPYISRARCVERQRGVDAAVAWLESVVLRSSIHRKLPYLLGWFHDEAGRPKEAIPHYHAAVEIASKQHGFTFDVEGLLVLDQQTRVMEQNAFADVYTPLEKLASCYERSGNPEAAFRTATMAISTGQQVWRDRFIAQEAVEAGSVQCRLVRARISLARHELDDVARDLRLAKVGNGPRGFAGWTGWTKEIEELEQALEAKAGR